MKMTASGHERHRVDGAGRTYNKSLFTLILLGRPVPQGYRRMNSSAINVDRSCIQDLDTSCQQALYPQIGNTMTVKYTIEGTGLELLRQIPRLNDLTGDVLYWIKEFRTTITLCGWIPETSIKV
ncbi:hypothetical protein ENBRE01_1737 [Enteropsectra breve]|nr:hypothetical protein ENBRE01_1737 [Enteropsectra breve]